MSRLFRCFFCSAIVVLSSLLSASAQKITVKSVEELSNDLSARTSPINDKNNKPCAVVKVDIPSVKGIEFNKKQVISQEYTPGEYILYVPEGTKKISFQHDEYFPGFIDFSAFNIKLASQVTYCVVMVPEAASTAPDLKSQYVVINVEPKTAEVYFGDEQIFVNDEGVAEKFVPFGKYAYSVEAPDYHAEEGMVTVSDQKAILNISLKPAFGYLTIDGPEESDSRIFIDGRQIGSMPVSKYRIASGDHSLKIVRALYAPYESSVKILDSQEKIINPKFSTNYANVSIIVPEEAEIWINDSLYGKGTWTGTLAKGEYKFETRLKSHRSYVHTIPVPGDGSAVKFETRDQDLVPIYGALNVRSNEAGATVQVDGEEIGQTPCIVPKVLIGEHNVTISKKGRSNYTEIVNVIEGKTSEIEGVLTKETGISIAVFDGGTKLSNPKILIDDQPFSPRTKYSFGAHQIKVSMEGFMDYSNDIDISDADQVFSVLLDRAYALRIKSNVKKNPKLEIDGVAYPAYFSANDVVVLAAGEHSIRLDGKGHKAQTRVVNLTGNQEIDFVLGKSAARKFVTFVGDVVITAAVIGALVVVAAAEVEGEVQ